MSRLHFRIIANVFADKKRRVGSDDPAWVSSFGGGRFSAYTPPPLAEGPLTRLPLFRVETTYHSSPLAGGGDHLHSSPLAGGGDHLHSLPPGQGGGWEGGGLRSRDLARITLGVAPAIDLQIVRRRRQADGRALPEAHPAAVREGASPLDARRMPARPPSRPPPCQGGGREGGGVLSGPPDGNDVEAARQDYRERLRGRREAGL